jgi:serine/threonine protein kinase
VLGSGGFADVFLFEQNMPRRQVAVKVMLPEVVDEQVRRMFQVEADLMAGLSAHPSILTVYEAGVSSDGRPYLVMELCSASLGQRYRREPLPVAEVLRIGVKVAGALHTAHHQGILHRDIKPSNILVTAYGAPVLSDFGIARTTRGRASSADAVGLSIPWSAPEVIEDSARGSVASEVWSLAATLYSLLAGRSPFEEPGAASTTPAELTARIAKARPGPIGRADVPPSLERLLARGMSKKPADRPASALELLTGLQAVEAELGFAPTTVEVAVADWVLDSVPDRGAVPASVPLSARSPDARRRRRAGEAAGARPSDDTSSGSGVSRPGGRRPDGRARRWRRPVIVLVVAAALVLGGAAVAVAVLGRDDAGIPRVTDMSAEVDADRVVFSWRDPGLGDGDGYRVETSTGQSSVQRSEQFAVAPTSDEPVCIRVSVVRDGRSGPAGAETCASVP